MHIEIDDMYQNVPVKATLDSGVTLVSGNSATGKSFFFEVLKCLAPKYGLFCGHLSAASGEVADFMAAQNETIRQQFCDVILAQMSAMNIMAISDADIFLTKEMLSTAVMRNPNGIFLLETQEILNFSSLKRVPMRHGRIYSEHRSLVLHICRAL